MRTGNTALPSAASRENKAVHTAWEHEGSLAAQWGTAAIYRCSYKLRSQSRSLIPAGGFWASINLSDPFTAQINWSSELLELKSCTRKACWWILNRMICSEPYPKFLSNAEHLQATHGCGEKAHHFTLSLCTKHTHTFTHDFSWRALEPKDMKHSYILKGRELQSILLPTSRRTKCRKDLPEVPSKVETGSPINCRNYSSQSPRWLWTILGSERCWFVQQHSGQEGKTQNTKTTHTVALLQTKYYTIFIQKPGIQGRLGPHRTPWEDWELQTWKGVAGRTWSPAYVICLTDSEKQPMQ